MSILLIFSENQLWFSQSLYISVSTWLISALSLNISCHLLLLGEFASFCSRVFRCAVKLLVYALSSFFLEALRALRFPLRNTFIVSHKFGNVVASFSLNSKKSLISFFTSSLTKVLLSRMLFNFQVNVGFLLLMLLLKISLSLWWTDRMHEIMSVFLYLWSLFCDQLYGQFWRRYHKGLRRRYTLLF